MYVCTLQVVTFIDLAGHEKYLKTTVFGMTGHAPDFSMLMVSFAVLLFFCLECILVDVVFVLFALCFVLMPLQCYLKCYSNWRRSSVVDVGLGQADFPCPAPE